MKCNNFLDLNIKKQQRFKPKLNKPKEILGFDTETRKGKAFLLACSDGSHVWSPDSISCLKFLHSNRFRSTLNVFWNIDYDVIACLKDLSKYQFTELYRLGEVTVDGFKLKYIPKKRFTITKDKHVTSFFDMAQFFMTSLNKASKKYLGEEKEEIDVKQFHSLKFIRENEKDILSYCLKDCMLTAKLGKYFSDMCSKINIDTSKPISGASLSVRYFNHQTVIPRFENPHAQEYAFNSYYGGRFETFKRGWFEKLHVYDIKSAYPSIIKNLLDLNKGTWIRSKTVLKDAVYGFLKVIITSNNPLLEILPQRNNGLITFPHLINDHRTIGLNEYNFIKEHNLADIKFINGYFFYPTIEHKPFALIQKVYDQRAKLKKEGNDLQMVLKLVMNSLYGKFLEQVPKWEDADPYDLSDDIIELITPQGVLTKKQVFHTGNYFNPVYASIITSETRLKVLKEGIKYPDDVVAFYTDSCVSERKFIKTGSKLGDWEYQGKFNGLILGNGVYTLQDGEDIYTRFRGFMVKRGFSLIDMLKTSPEAVSLAVERQKVLKLGEILSHYKKHSLEALNTFYAYNKNLNINFDHKRLWDRKFTSSRDALSNTIQSKPLLL